VGENVEKNLAVFLSGLFSTISLVLGIGSINKKKYFRMFINTLSGGID